MNRRGFFGTLIGFFALRSFSVRIPVDPTIEEINNITLDQLGPLTDNIFTSRAFIEMMQDDRERAFGASFESPVRYIEG